MNEINKTLYIPLYGKSYVSKKGIILEDKKAEEIWEKVKFPLKNKSKSKWLAYYMGMRAKVFDNYALNGLDKETVIIHLGCGLDSRNLRTSLKNKWYDVDFPEVIKERKMYYKENDNYRMIASDVRDKKWINEIKENKSAVILMEGISMYLKEAELIELFINISVHFEKIKVFMDAYTSFAAKASKYKNPVNEVGVSEVFGIDDPNALENEKIKYAAEWEITPDYLINELKGFEKALFKKLYGGNLAKKLYKLYEFKADDNA